MGIGTQCENLRNFFSIFTLREIDFGPFESPKPAILTN